MSLLPNRFQIVNDMPSLGALVREAIQPKPDPNRVFESDDHWMYSPRVGKLHVIEEKDCRQIKGAAQEHALGASKDLASASVAAPPSPAVVAGKFKKDDRIRMKRERGLWREGATGVVLKVLNNESMFVNFDQGHAVGDHQWWVDMCYAELIPPAVTPDDGGLIEGAIYKVKFPSGNVWLSRWESDGWHGSADDIAILKNKENGMLNPKGKYEMLKLEWKP